MRRIDVSPTRPTRGSRGALVCLCFSALVSGLAAQSTPSSQRTPDEPSEIVQRMVQQNLQRSEDLKYYTSLRHYHIEFHGLGRTLAADMHAQVIYKAGSGKTFQVIDESGSHALLNHVLLKLLDTESDDSHQQQTALSPANYDFVFQNEATENGRPLYVFSVEPKTKNKLLYRGKIWIDAGDFAVVRVEAQPAESPSFWITSTEIHSSNAKIGEFWLPQLNRSESKTRFGGTAVLIIDYGTYQFDKSHALTSAAADLSSRTAQPAAY
jgi:outer membrane lipoprotein-sorting protein